ncbi:hypothetical protein [Clostridium sp. BJN0001]|uniref:hypothetical protein n=1 Tax=Clostridium sp. BJN0001 TaxID=2930219 RepID=UPI001FD040DA|nr:hypothetical protein [Clostridium sp. BJN0001]
MSKKVRTLNDNIKDLLDNKKLFVFIRWYLNGAKDEDFKTVQQTMDIQQDKKWAIKNYLEREDVQRAMIEITKLNKDFNLVQIYNKMLENALKGDVNSANWIVKFSESEFFDKKVNEVQNIIDKLDLEE